jgi:hypothetical protein
MRAILNPEYLSSYEKKTFFRIAHSMQNHRHQKKEDR